MIDKSTFLEYYQELKKYDRKITDIDNILEIDFSGAFIGYMLDNMGELLIHATNPALEPLHFDYFMEQLWASIYGSPDSLIASELYDDIVDDTVDPEYIRMYGIGE